MPSSPCSQLRFTSSSVSPERQAGNHARRTTCFKRNFFFFLAIAWYGNLKTVSQHLKYDPEGKKTVCRSLQNSSYWAFYISFSLTGFINIFSANDKKKVTDIIVQHASEQSKLKKLADNYKKDYKKVRVIFN